MNNSISQAVTDSVEIIKDVVDTGIEQVGVKTRPLSQANQLFPKIAGQKSDDTGSDNVGEKDKRDFRTKIQISQLQKQLEGEINKARQQREQQLQQRREVKKETGQLKEEKKPMSETIETSMPKKGMPGANTKRVKSAQQQSQPETSGQRMSG